MSRAEALLSPGLTEAVSLNQKPADWPTSSLLRCRVLVRYQEAADGRGQEELHQSQLRTCVCLCVDVWPTGELLCKDSSVCYSCSFQKWVYLERCSSGLSFLLRMSPYSGI